MVHQNEVFEYVPEGFVVVVEMIFLLGWQREVADYRK